MSRTRRVGYCIRKEKLEYLGWNEVVAEGERRGLAFEYIDLSSTVEGCYDVVIHKITDLYSSKSEESTAKLERFKAFVLGNPRMAVLDPLSSIEKMLGRDIINTSVEAVLAPRTGRVFVPPSFRAEKLDDVVAGMERHGIKFPIIAKPVEAVGKSLNHILYVIFNVGGIRDVGIFPIVVQQYYNHYSTVFKGYAIDGSVEARPRQSTSSFGPEDVESETIAFDTKKEMPPRLRSQEMDVEKAGTVEPGVLEIVRSAISEALGMSLYGFDLIRPEGEERYALIDVNYFPSFSKFDRFPEKIVDLVWKRIQAIDEN